MSNIIDSIQLSGITYQIEGDVTVDAALDSGSTNPVANSAITTALDDKVNVVDNEVPDYVVESEITYQGGYPSQTETASTWDAASMFTLRYNFVRSSDANFITTAAVIDPSNNIITGRVTTSETSIANPLPSYIDMSFSLDDNVYKFTAKEGYRIAHLDVYNDKWAAWGYIREERVETVFEGGQSADVIKDVIEPTLINKQDKLVAGENITINGNVISSTGGVGTVDPSLDPTSTNPVANSAITAALGDKVNVADNNVSAYTFENKIGGVEYSYSEHFAGPLYIRYTGSTSSSGGFYAGSMLCYTSEWNWNSVYLYFNLSNGQITATTTSSAYFDIEIENGEATLTFKDGYYLRQYDSQNGFVALTKTTYESGQSADVIEDTVYDVFDKLNDKIDKTGDNAVTGGSISFSDGYLNLNLRSKNESSSSVKIDSSTIKSSNNGLIVQFATPEVADKILNVGSDSYGQLFYASSYDTSINEFTITFNPNCTQYGVYNFSVRFIEASNITYGVIFNYDSADMSAVYTDLSTYCTVTDTLSTDYKIKVVAKEGYRISRLYNGNYMVGGVDNTEPNNHISNFVTTPSYVQDGQDVIDDIYDKLDDKQDQLVSGTNIKTINNQSLLGSGNIDIQGGSSYTAGDGIDITNDVISVTGKVGTSAITTSITSSSTDAQVPSAKAVNDKLGGLSLVKLTQAEYDALATKNNSTLYVIID